MSDILNFLTDDLTLEIFSPESFEVWQLQALPKILIRHFLWKAQIEWWIRLLDDYFELEGPYFSPYQVPQEKQLVLFYAPAPSVP